MGVGAIFISTLALSELKVPHDPPQNQEEFLAATLQIIVSFIVLCSIIIRKSNTSHLRGLQRWSQDLMCIATDGLSIPFFSFSRRIHSRTVSLTRTWTSGQGGWGQGQPDWMSRIKRSESAPPSQIISRQDEETGDRFETQTGIEGISEVDRNGGTPTDVSVRKSGSS